MDHLREAYASSSSDEHDLEEKAAAPSALGELPPELKSIFKDSGEMFRCSQPSTFGTHRTPHAYVTAREREGGRMADRYQGSMVTLAPNI